MVKTRENWIKHRQFNHGFVDEVLRSAYDDLFCLLNNVADLNHPYETRVPPIVMFSDGYQLSLSSVRKDINPFSANKKLFNPRMTGP